MTTQATKTVHLPQLHRQLEEIVGGNQYLILFEGRHWSKTTNAYPTIAECYQEARQIVSKQYKIPADAVIRDYHGTWQY